VDARIRDYRGTDEQAVVELSLRAWAPVFASMEQVLGSEIFILLHGDWRQFQETSVRAVLAESATRAWVAEAGGRVIGFVTAAQLDPERLIGEISMLAVDPDGQGQRVGTALTEFATAWLRDSGMRVVMVDTGGDAGHAPARRVYERTGYTQMPVARYFKAV
jgi:GNAT superfamily N-acetyltransferase